MYWQAFGIGAAIISLGLTVLIIFVVSGFRRKMGILKKEPLADFISFEEGASRGFFRREFYPQDHFVHANPSITKLLGSQADDYFTSAASYDESIHPEDRPVWDSYLADHSRNNETILIRWRQSGAKYVWLEKQVAKTYDASGRLTAIACLAQDVTGRKEAEERSAVFQRIFEGASEAIAVTNLKGEVIYVNPAYERLFKRTSAEVCKKNWLETYPNDTREFIQREVMPIVTSGGTWEGVVEARSGDGRIFPLWKRLDVAYDKQQRPLCFFSFMHDISGQQSAEDIFRRETGLVASILDTAGALIVVLDTAGRIVRFNRACEQISGYTFDEVRNKPFWEFFAGPEDRARYQQKFSDLLSGRTPAKHEQYWRDKEGRKLLINWSTTIIKDNKDRPAFIFATGLDVTEQRHLQEEHLQLEKRILQTQKTESLGVLAGGVAHDFNNLLMGILGNAGLALSELPQDSSVRETIKEIELSALRAADLTNQMLAYSGKGKFFVQPIVLSKIVSDMAHLLHLVINKKISLKFNFAPDLPAVEADATQMRQMVMNLVTNASDAIGERNGVITISTGIFHVTRAVLSQAPLGENLSENDYVFLEVADTGCGMEEETRQKVFDPFFSTKVSGRGLGLAAVLGIVRGHNGAILVDSAPGRGSSFRILMPSAVGAPVSAPAVQPAVPISTSTANQAGSILVIDDEMAVRSVVEKTLVRDGFTVYCAPDGPTGIELFRRHLQDISLVLLDLTMPHMSGDEVFRRLREIKADICVVLSSGYTEQDVRSRLNGLAPAGFLQKPYRISALKEMIRQVLHLS